MVAVGIVALATRATTGRSTGLLLELEPEGSKLSFALGLSISKRGRRNRVRVSARSLKTVPRRKCSAGTYHNFVFPLLEPAVLAPHAQEFRSFH